MLPVAEHPQALEVGPLQCDLLGGIGAALGLHVVAAQAPPVGLFDGVFDRQAMAVPAGHVLRVEAGQLPCLDDHVLQHLVDGMTHVDLPVGIGRAVVQDELGRVAAHVAQLLVQALFVPLLYPARLALGQVAAHREGRVGQVERGSVIGLGRGCSHGGRAPPGCAGRQSSGSGWAAVSTRPGSRAARRLKFGRAWSACMS